MESQPPDRTGILIVRVWMEGNAPEGFRARITGSLDSASPEKGMATAANPRGIYSAVRTWVEAFVARGSPDRESLSQKEG
jgi:hypothetical protein